MARRRSLATVEAPADVPPLNGTTPVYRDVTLSTGVVIRCKAVSGLILSRIYEQRPIPEVPTRINPDTERAEPNPDDPEYLSDLDERNMALLGQINKAFVILGTEVASLPKGMEGPDGDEWVKTLESIGLSVSDDRRSRYREWFLTTACADAADGASVIRTVGILSNIRPMDEETT